MTIKLYRLLNLNATSTLSIKKNKNEHLIG